jgi:hypothetical protein
VVNLRRAAIGLAFTVTALLGSACAAAILVIAVQVVCGHGSEAMGKDFIAIPAVAVLAFLLLKAASDLWRRLWTVASVAAPSDSKPHHR